MIDLDGLSLALGFTCGVGASFVALMAWCGFVDWHTRRQQRRAWRWDRRPRP